jgi:molybdenum cofactor biosynthesis enzyme MoaA
MTHWGIEKVRITGGEPLMRNSVVTLVEMLSRIEGIKDLGMTTNGVRLAEFALEFIPSFNHGPAKYFKLNGSKGLLGFISPASSPFCSSCTRLCLTAEGKLRPCLFSDFTVDLKRALREKGTESQIKALFDLAVGGKPKGYDQTSYQTDRFMFQIGG